jgi:hypothetical protein
LQTIAFAAPLLPGKTDADRDALAACGSGDRAAMGPLATSDDPIDVWFRGHIRDVHAVDITEESAPPEQVLDYRA